MSSGSVLLRNVTRAEWGGEWRCGVENQLGAKEVVINLVVFGEAISRGVLFWQKHTHLFLLRKVHFDFWLCFLP